MGFGCSFQKATAHNCKSLLKTTDSSKLWRDFLPDRSFIIRKEDREAVNASKEGRGKWSSDTNKMKWGDGQEETRLGVQNQSMDSWMKRWAPFGFYFCYGEWSRSRFKNWISLVKLSLMAITVQYSFPSFIGWGILKRSYWTFQVLSTLGIVVPLGQSWMPLFKVQ